MMITQMTCRPNQMYVLSCIYVHRTYTPYTLQTPMDQWLKSRSRYLHLLLEMEGLTKAPKCSICALTMEIKCSDCIGGNYFCRTCCLDVHKRSPFHRMSRWTGAYFSPTSLYSLGFMLCLGHNGELCPSSLEVMVVLFCVFDCELICI